MALIVETWYHTTCDFCGLEGPKTLLRWALTRPVDRRRTGRPKL